MRIGKRNSAQSLMLLGLSLGYFMVLLDMTVVSVALPAIGKELGGGLSGLQWVVNAYTIVFAALLLAMGAIADRFGAKRVYLLGLAVFLAASVLLALAPTLGALIALRAVLGAGGAALMPSSLTLLTHAYEDPAERTRALGVWAAITGVAMAAGPLVGGVLVDTLGWRSIFGLQVPLAAVSLLLTMRFVQGAAKREPARPGDAAGQITAIIAIAALSFGLMEGETIGWRSPIVLGALGASLLGALLFLWAQARGRAPMLPLRLFRQATVPAGMLAGLIINAGLSGVLFMLPLFFQQSLGYSAQAAGLALLPMMVPLAFNPILTGKMAAKTGAKLPMTLGFALGGLGTLLLAGVGIRTYGLVALLGLVGIGFGVSFVIPSLMSAVLSAVPKEQTGAASGALNASRQLGAAIGVAVLGAILSASPSFLVGMRTALGVVTVLFALGVLLSLVFMEGMKNSNQRHNGKIREKA